MDTISDRRKLEMARTTVLSCLIFVILIAKGSKGQFDSSKDIEDAMNLLPPPMAVAVKPFQSELLTLAKSVAECIEGEVKQFDLCNFNATYDPFALLEICTKGTVANDIITSIVSSFPTFKADTGIPPVVPKTRCFLPSPPGIGSTPFSAIGS
ncbi:uncharacterized protein LOC118196391 isoform X1 [Stegodyphus dumicola]|uniref:uncharacterized protein LOC118196391 isoform X1 n=1 Tax=Stegodyphus dumicola TaxID=202533 RepID=UPI0015B0A808|nr:uncharacterized protein LOC118196391 isoform X1 [Stegodyphus dumicola]